MQEDASGELTQCLHDADLRKDEVVQLVVDQEKKSPESSYKKQATSFMKSVKEHAYR